MNKLLGIYTPVAIFAAIAANAVLSRFGLNYVYALMMALAMAVMATRGISLSAIFHKPLLLVYFASILIMTIVHLMMRGGEPMIAGAALIYTFMPLYWFLYFCRYDDVYLNKVIGLTIPMVYAVGLLGLTQFFISPDLFGLIVVKSDSLEWAANAEFDVYSAFFRASSTMGSPQVYGLFMALSIVLIHSRAVNAGKIRLFTWLGIAFLLCAGFLSGNKSFIVILLAYFIMRTLAIRRRVLLKTVAGLLLLISATFGLVKFAEYVPVLERFTSIEQALTQEEGDSRMGKYRFIVSNTDPLVGNGLGTLTNRSASGIRAAESYILKLYYETGAVIAGLFICIMFGAYLHAVRSEIAGARELIALIFISMIIVHAFDSPAFFVFWGILISTCGANRGRKADHVHGNYCMSDGGQLHAAASSPAHAG